MVKNINKRRRELEVKHKKQNPTVEIKNKTVGDVIVKSRNSKNNDTSKNNTIENIEKMNREELTKANNIIDSMNQDKANVKRIKSDKGLIERVEMNKVVLTEDNKMLLKD